MIANNLCCRTDPIQPDLYRKADKKLEIPDLRGIVLCSESKDANQLCNYCVAAMYEGCPESFRTVPIS